MLYLHIHTSLINQALWANCNNYNHHLEGHSAIKAFYYIKAKDSAGSGYADISIEELAKIFGRSWSTIRRWLRFGKQLGIFRGVIKLKKGYYRIYYKSVIKICLENGITDLGSIIEVEVNELKDIKFRATEADAIRAQDKSFYAATKNDKALAKNTISPKNLCCKSKRILFLSDRFVYVSPNRLMYGASQKYIADNSGYSISTIQRRLDAKYRQAHGILPVIKKQQCIRLSKEEANEAIVEQREAEFFGEKSNVIFRNNKFKDLSFKPYTNIYWIPEEDIQYRPQRYLRARLNRECAKKDEENQLISSANAQKPASRRIDGDKNKLLIKDSSGYTLRQINKSFRIKLLDWIKELNFSSYSKEFEKVFDNYLVESDEIQKLVDTLLVSFHSYTNNPFPQKGRVL